jgi:hypothetical protein
MTISYRTRIAIRSADKAVLHAEGKRVSVRLDPKAPRPPRAAMR